MFDVRTKQVSASPWKIKIKAHTNSVKKCRANFKYYNKTLIKRLPKSTADGFIEIEFDVNTGDLKNFLNTLLIYTDKYKIVLLVNGERYVKKEFLL